jgi:hypothetical protein
MIGFVEKLPTEWEPKFQKLLLNANGKAEDFKGKLFPKSYTWVEIIFALFIYAETQSDVVCI